MIFLFGHKSGHFRRVRCGKKAKYWAFRAFWSKMLVGRMSGIFRHFLGIFGANHLVTLLVQQEEERVITTSKSHQNAPHTINLHIILDFERFSDVQFGIFYNSK